MDDIASDCSSAPPALLGQPNVQAQSKVIQGPQCWKCFGWETWWTCQGCDRSYHKKCAFFGPAFPHPIFDLEMVKAVDAEKGASLLLQCTQCTLAEVTLISTLRHAPVDGLTKVFANVASMVQYKFSEIVEEISKDVTSPTHIRNKVIMSKPGHYKTLEAFIAEYQLIKLQCVGLFGIDSQEVDAISSLLDWVRSEFKVAILCWECYLRRYDPMQLGKMLPAAAFYRENDVVCTVPHPVIWVRLPEYSSGYYWPAKLLVVNEVTGKAGFQCFEEKAMRFVKEGVELYFYSNRNPNRKDQGRPSQPRLQLNRALIICEKYVNNLQEKFGADKVFIPEKMDAFTGSYEQAFQKMFLGKNMQSLLAPGASN